MRRFTCKTNVLYIITGLVLAAVSATAEKPNVVLILADDLGWKDLACYGHAVHKTPNLDRLASQGMQFSDAYAASCVCSPTRSSIMTGKYPARNDLTIWLGGGGGAPAANHMALSEVTIAEALKEHGYATAHVGKWHLGGDPYLPQHQGFDVNIAGTHAGSPAGGYFLPNKMRLDGMQPGSYLTDRLTDECLGIMETWRERPFFIYMSYHTVHTPIQGRKDLVKHYQDKRRPGDVYNPTYAAMVHCLDENVGRIMKQLDDLKLDERTLVIFFSDNGGFSHSRGKKNNVTSNQPLRLGKGDCYEGGHREPMIVRYPPVIEPGGACRAPVISTDFYPTILELVGAPARPGQHADGVSIMPLLRDPSAELPRDTLYWHYPHNSPQGGTPSGAIREGHWKLIEFFNDGRSELYDLAGDIGEGTDLSEKMPDKAREMREKLAAWRDSVDAKMPPARGAAAKPAPGITKTFPGFSALVDVAIAKGGLGFELAARETGLALMEPNTPLKGHVTLKARLKPVAAHPANAFLVFGAGPTDADTVKCGIFVGGKRAAIFEGGYPQSDETSTAFVSRSGETYEVTVTVHTDTGQVEMSVGDVRLSRKLKRPLPEIACYGYGVIRTRSTFEAVTVNGRD